MCVCVMAKVKPILLLVSVLLSLALLPISHCAKKPVTVARKEDLPYIECQVCEKLAAQLYHQVQKKEAQIAPKKVLLSSGFNVFVRKVGSVGVYFFVCLNLTMGFLFFWR